MPRRPPRVFVPDFFGVCVSLSGSDEDLAAGFLASLGKGGNWNDLVRKRKKADDLEGESMQHPISLGDDDDEPLQKKKRTDA